MSLSRLWLFLAVALPVLAAAIATMSSVDLAYQLRAGAGILDSGAIPTVDTWTFTAAGLPWTDQQWGAQVLLALAERLGSWTGLVLVRAALTAIIFGSLLVIARRRGLDARTAALLVLAAFVVAAPALALRPQLFGMACFALVLLCITERRRDRRLLWLVPLVTIAWANLHGSFVLAPVALGLAWLEDVHDRVARPHLTLIVALVTVVAASLTPFGPAVWAYAAGLSANPEVTARITEWQPTSIRTIAGLLFFGSVAAIVVLIARSGRVLPWPTLAWLGTFTLLGLYAERGVAWFPLAAVVAVAGTLVAPAPDRVRTEPAMMRRLNVVVAGAIVVAAIAVLPAWRPADPATGAPDGLLTDAPPGLTEALRANVQPGDHVFQPQPWGSWFEYAVPEARYTVDSRIELFPPEVWSDYAAVVAGVDGWQERLASWSVRLAVVADDQAGFRSRLVDAGWRIVTADDDGSLLEAP
jgi:hypothetical protein